MERGEPLYVLEASFDSHDGDAAGDDASNILPHNTLMEPDVETLQLSDEYGL